MKRGAPIPIVYCPAHGEQPVPVDRLPVELPELTDFAPDGSRRSPLARATEWVRTTCPVCGGPAERDAVYHQGTVWAWLVGPFVAAYLNVNGHTPESVAHARTLLDPLLVHLKEACLGHVSEIFDGDAPHTPRGCVAQAWSVAELLRALVEDVLSSGED